MSEQNSKQIEADRTFCGKAWKIWKEYGGGTDGSDENFWPEVTSKLDAICLTPLQIAIGMVILEEIRRRSK